MEKQIMNTEQAAEYLGLSPNTLNQWRSNGTGPKYHKPSSRVMYRVKDLDEWVSGGLIKKDEN